jgi:hypothetical protein
MILIDNNTLIVTKNLEFLWLTTIYSYNILKEVLLKNLITSSSFTC